MDGFETEPQWGSEEVGDALEEQVPEKYFERVLEMCQNHFHDPNIEEYECKLARALGHGCKHLSAQSVSTMLAKYTNPSNALLIAITYWANTREKDDYTTDLLLQLILLGHNDAVFHLYLEFKYVSVQSVGKTIRRGEATT